MLLIKLLSFLSVFTLPPAWFVTWKLWFCNLPPFPTDFLVGAINRSHWGRVEGKKREKRPFPSCLLTAPISITSAVIACHPVISSWSQPPTFFIPWETDSSQTLRGTQHQPGCAHFSGVQSLDHLDPLSFWVLITQPFPFVPPALKVIMDSYISYLWITSVSPIWLETSQPLCNNTLLLSSFTNIVWFLFFWSDHGWCSIFQWLVLKLSLVTVMFSKSNCLKS